MSTGKRNLKRNGRSARVFPVLGFLAWALAVPGAQALAATQFVFTSAPAAVPTHIVGNTLNFTVEAHDGGGLDASFNDAVTLELYDVDQAMAWDPTAEFVSGGVTQSPSTPLQFTDGVLSFSLTFKAGSNGEQVRILHDTISTGNAHPAAPPHYVVRGNTTFYYARDAQDNSTPADYTGTGSFDILSSNEGDLTGAAGGAPSTVVGVPNSNGRVGSSAYVITGVTGGYAYGNLGVVPRLFFRRANLGGNPVVTAEVILIYDGSDLPPDYDSPRPSKETVYRGTATGLDNGFNFSSLNSFALDGAYQAPQSLMNNGQVVLRVWSNDTGTTPVTMRALSSAVTALSRIEIPYSAANAQPVKSSFLNGPLTLASGSSTSVDYVIENEFSSGITQVLIQVPNAPHGGSQYWFVNGAITSTFGTAVVSTQASGSGPGTITLSMPATLASDAGVTLTIPLVVSDTTFDAWTFPMVSALADNGVEAFKDSDEAVLATLGVPGPPTGVAAQAVDLNGAGNAVSLSWTPPGTAEDPTDFRIDRSPGGGFPVTVSFSQTSYVDGTASNLTAYTYEISTLNAVSSSTTVTVGPVTPFVNPGPPGSLTAATGNDLVQLDWTAGTANSYPLAGYRIYRDTSPGMGGAVTIQEVGAGTFTYNDVTASEGSQYYYYVTAIDDQYAGTAPPGGEHNSLPSSPVQSGFPDGFPPQNPGVTLVSSAPATLQFSWSAPVSNLAAPVSFLVFRGVNGPVGGAPYTIVDAATLLADDDAVVAGDFYVYRVAGLSAGGVTTNLSSPVTGYVLPSAPDGVTAFGTASEIVLDWDPNPVGEEVTEYRVYQDQSGSPKIILAGSPPPAGPVTMTGFAFGVDFDFEVSAVNVGGEGNRSSPVVTSSRLPFAPTSPAAVPNASNPHHVDLTWAPSSPVPANLSGYNVYRDPTSTFPGAGGLVQGGLPTSPLSFTDTSLPVTAAGQDYYYFIAAVNSGGVGPPVPVLIRIPPSAPTGVNASSTAATITVTWNAVSGENVTGYRVHRVDPSGPTTVSFGPVVPTSYDDGSAAPGVDYEYYVSAVNSGGEGPLSSAAPIGRLPQAPTGLAALAPEPDNDIPVTWTAVTGADPNATAVSLIINTQNSPTAGSPVTVGLAAGAVSHLDAGNAADTIYYYWLQGTNPYGDGPLAGPASQLTYPGAIGDLAVTLALDGITRVGSWTDPGGNVTSYNVYRRQGGIGPFALVQPVLDATFGGSVTLTQSVQAGQGYEYRIRAVNSSGEGPDSNSSFVNIPPAPPTGLTARSGVTDASARVDLAWQAVTGQGVSNYHIYRMALPAGSFVSIGNAGSGSTTVFSDPVPSGPLTYAYKVLSYNNSTTPIGSAVPVTVVAFALPGTPGALTASEGVGQVTLSWGSSTPGSYALAGYNLYRSTSAGVTGTRVNATPIPSSPFTNTGLANLTTHYYFVEAQDANGNLSPAMSGQASAMPVARPLPPQNVAIAQGDEALQITWNLPTQPAGSLPAQAFRLYRRTPPTTGSTSLIATLGVTVTGYVDSSGLVNGVNYEYWLETVDSTGTLSIPHLSVESNHVIQQPVIANISPPDNISSTIGDGTFRVDWTDSFVPIGGAPVTGYVLWKRTGTSAFSPYATIGSGVETYLDSGISVVNGTQYSYYLVAWADTIPVTTSPASATITGVPSAPPASPTPILVVDGDDRADLSWGPSAGAGSVTIQNYTVYRAVLPGGQSALTVTANPVTAFSDTTLTNGTTVVYNLTAINSNGQEGAQSPAVMAYPYVMGPPSSVANISDDTSVDLTWSPPTTPVSSFPVASYTVTRVDPQGVSQVFVGQSSPFSDATAVPGVLYSWYVQAVDDKGHVGPASTPVLDGTATNPPPAPSPLVAYPGNGQNLVDWAPVTATAPRSLPVSYYILTRTSGGTVILPPGTTWYLDEGLTNGVQVDYTVVAVDVSGHSGSPFHVTATPAAVSETPALANLNPPTNLDALALDSTSVLLTWDPPNESRDIESYVITRSNSFNGPYGNPVTLSLDVFPPPLFTTVGGLLPGRTYYFRIQAVERNTGITSSNSNTAYAATPSGGGAGLADPGGDLYLSLNLMRLFQGDSLLIYYLVPDTADVKITIHTVAGTPIRTLEPGIATAGVEASAVWDGLDRNGNPVASGLYLIHLQAGNFHRVKKVIVVK